MDEQRLDGKQEHDEAGGGTPPGGRTTNSPPAKSAESVPVAGRVLTAGFDTLVLSVDVTWMSSQFLGYLEKLKQGALKQDAPMPGFVDAGSERWLFTVEPFGSRGYAWVLRSSEFTVTIGNWLKPRSRPSLMIEIRSQALWLNGVIECVDKFLKLLNYAGAKIEEAKASRADACLDILLSNDVWNSDLRRHRVCRAHSLATHEVHDHLTGYEIGSGGIQARLYDKDEEIRKKSNKTWMFDIWGLQEVPEGATAVRVEFQLRRETMRELGIDGIWSLVNHPRSLWAYCTHKWLKFIVDPKLHGDQHQTMPWWETVQDGFLESQGAHPFIRAKIIQANKKQIAQQLLGQVTSLIALETDTGEAEPEVKLEEHAGLLTECAELLGMKDDELSDRVKRKLAKYVRGIEKFQKAEKERKELGLPQMMKIAQSA